MDGTYMCLKTYQNEDDGYGLDFLSTKTYSYTNGYMHSTENGSDVMIEKDELEKHWHRIV